MIAKIVLLYLTVYNCDTGAVLYQSARQMPVFSVSGDRLEIAVKKELAKRTHLRPVTVRRIPMRQPTWFADGNVRRSQYNVDVDIAASPQPPQDDSW